MHQTDAASVVGHLQNTVTHVSDVLSTYEDAWAFVVELEIRLERLLQAVPPQSQRPYTKCSGLLKNKFGVVVGYGCKKQGVSFFVHLIARGMFFPNKEALIVIKCVNRALVSVELLNTIGKVPNNGISFNCRI